MKKFFTPVIILTVMVLTPHCKKAYDYIEHNPNAEMKNCIIQKFVFSGPYWPKDSITFTYNQCGDPITGIRPSPGTGAPNYVFNYDKKGRLTEFIGMYAFPTGSEFWHKYFYDNKGQIVLDSNYIFCKVENGQPVDPALTPFPDGTSVTFYCYDAKGRIIKDSTFSASYDWNIVNTYAYDATGNLTGKEYDQKINFHRTNKIWMFLDRDYSVNNPFTAVKYNSNGLPTKISLPSKGIFPKFIYSFNEAEITYSCR